jgi:FO synthase subunit 1
MRLVTYSKNVFIPVTDLCRNRCGYCSYWREPGDARIIRRSVALKLLAGAATEGCSEALFSLGESPWEVEGFLRLAKAVGISDLVDYLVELCEQALEAGLLPHTNAGVLTEDHLRRLAPYNASMGMMLETTAIVAAHASSPGKRPDIRRDFIALAGKMRIPFTTGILVGIGESREDRCASLQAIADLHRSFDHIQEVIVQPLDPKPGTALVAAKRPGMGVICETVKMAREILPGDVALQIPPNLVDPLPLIEAGANDLGGISTVTPDWINPERPWPDIESLRRRFSGYDLRERLPIYPRYVRKGWQGVKTGRLIKVLADEDGLRRKEYLP